MFKMKITEDLGYPKRQLYYAGTFTRSNLYNQSMGYYIATATQIPVAKFQRHFSMRWWIRTYIGVSY